MTKTGEAGGRGSREIWLSAAYQALVESGIEAVRIQPLGKRVELSRTSFYWFFKDREDLLAGLLDQWREKNTGALLGRSAAYAESLAEAVLNVVDCWLDPALFDPHFEFAVRSWGLQSPEVAQAIGQADGLRITALADLFVRFGFEASEADVRGRAMYLTQIGSLSLTTREDLPTSMARVPHYVEIFTGTSAKRRELARFHARHAFAPAIKTADTHAA